MKRIFTSLFLLLIAGHSFAQTFVSSASTAGVKNPLLEVAVATWAGYSPDAAQNLYETIKPLYPHTIAAFWHSSALITDPMTVPGDPYCIGTGYIGGFPAGTIDRTDFGGSIGQSRPFDAFVAAQYSVAPTYDVSISTSYNTTTRALTIQVTGTALDTLAGNWRINAYIVEDSISSGLSAAYNQVDSFSGTALLSCTGSPSWYAAMPNPITSGSDYSHMNVVRAIAASGANIWGDSAFVNPAAGTTFTRTYSATIPSYAVPKNVRVIGLVQKYGTSTSDRAIENAVETSILPTLAFTAGHTQTLSVCSGSASVPLDTMLSVIDTSTGHFVVWTGLTGPAHGTLTASYVTTSTGGILVPSGLTYAATSGYTGADTFSVVFSDGGLTDTTIFNVTVNPTPAPITGTVLICAGDTVTLTDTPTTGGVWTSGAPAIATIDTGGNVIGVTGGTSVITYALPGGCFSTVAVTVNTISAGVISGANTVCTGGTITLTPSAPGGTWSSSLPFVAVVDTALGVVSGITSGIATISYTVVSTCGAVAATWQVTVSSTPNAGTINGPSSLCVGRHIMLTDVVVPGTWSSTNTRAVVTSVGVVVGAIGGLDTMIYTAVLSCGTATVSKVITIVPLPDTGVIAGMDTICVGLTMPYTNVASGGVWSSANGKVTFVSGGIVTATAMGVDTIRYTASDSCGTLTATHPIYIGAAGTCAVHTNQALNSSHDIELYPDPARTALTISASQRISSVVITDLAGHKLLDVNNSSETAVIDVSGLPNGIYLVRINGSATRKFVKE